MKPLNKLNLEKLHLEKYTNFGHARLLTPELMKDGKLRTKKEIVDTIIFILRRKEMYNDKPAIEEGVGYALKRMNCKIARNLYQVQNKQ